MLAHRSTRRRTCRIVAAAVVVCAAFQARRSGAQDAATDSDTAPASDAAVEAPVHATDEPSPADEQSAERALGRADDDMPDPVADEGERTGTAEGEPLPGRSIAANEIAALTDRACLRALLREHVPIEIVRRSVAGVATPIRLTGAVGGVRYRASDRREIHELMDCRLAVALVRFSRMLRHLGINEVLHYSTYRPPSSSAAARQPLQTRHPGGMAIDAAWFVRDDGQRFNVERDFHGHRGRVVCGPDARVPHHEGARLLRSIACDSARRGLFHVILTPNHNYEHRNHFHLEVTRAVNWQYVH